MNNVNLKASPETRDQIQQLIALELIANGKVHTIKSYLAYLVGEVAKQYNWPVQTTGQRLNAGQFAMKAQSLMAEISAADVSNVAALDQFRRLYLGRQGRLADLFDNLVRLPNESRQEVGLLLNKIKQDAQERFDKARAALENNE